MNTGKTAVAKKAVKEAHDRDEKGRPEMVTA